MIKTFKPIMLACFIAVPAARAATSVEVTVDGVQYDITKVTAPFSVAAAELEAEPWYGSSSLAQTFAADVADALGGQSASSFFSTNSYGPLFAYGATTNFVSAQYYDTGDLAIAQKTFLAGRDVTYAAVVPAPEPSVYALSATAAALFIGWRRWRAPRIADAATLTTSPAAPRRQRPFKWPAA